MYASKLNVINRIRIWLWLFLCSKTQNEVEAISLRLIGSLAGYKKNHGLQFNVHFYEQLIKKQLNILCLKELSWAGATPFSYLTSDVKDNSVWFGGELI